MPYNSQYFGHKLHVDLNEKLVDFNCLLVGAIDGFSGKLLSYFTIHRKNCINVCPMYREICIKHGVWDQIRVDYGTEFMLMLYLQHKLQEFRSETESFCPNIIENGTFNCTFYEKSMSNYLDFLNFV